jgi:FkbM family methyltransferase
VRLGSLIRRIDRFVRDVDEVRTLRVRSHTYPVLARMSPFLGVQRDGIRYVLSTGEGRGVAFTTWVYGKFDEETLNRTLATLGLGSLSGLTVLEVGANIGTETVSFLRRHGAERVVAFEPDAENARLLRANVALNGLHDRVQVHELALTDHDGTALFECSHDNWGDHRVRVAQPRGEALRAEDLRPTVEVVARSIDSLAASGELDLDTIDFVWMDAQGHEGHILDGARRLVAAGIPILTEYWPYGLRRAGGLDRFHAIVAEGYEAVVDVRTGTGDRPVRIDAADVAQLERRYADDPGGDGFDPHTDLVLLPRPRSGGM